MTTKPVRFAVAQRSTSEGLGLFAQSIGLFAEHGVDFQLLGFEMAADRGVEGLLSGAWDYMEIGVVPWVRVRADGHDPAIIVGTTPVNTGFLMGRSDIADLAALAGGRVGCLSLGGQTASAARAVLARHGLDDAVELVPLVTYPRIFEAVAAGEIEGAIFAGDYRFPGEVRHGMRVLADVGAETGFPGTCVTTLRRHVAADPDLARRIVHVYVDAVDAFKTRPDTAKAFLRSHLGFEDAAIDRVYDYYVPVFRNPPRPSLPHVQAAIDEIAKARPDAAKLTPADLLDLRFLDEIAAGQSRA